jgi:uncharacterized protein (TIRG00374 family)
MPKTKGKKNKYISYLLRFSVAAAALYLAFRGEDFRQVADILLGLNLWIFAAALGFYLIAQLIFAFRWNLLMRVQSIKIGYWPAFRLHLLGLFYNNCLPGSVGGDLVRIWYVTKHTDKKLEAGLSVFVDRVVGLTGVLIMAFFCYWFIPEQGRKGRFAFPYKVNLSERLTEHRWLLLGTAAAFAIIIAAFISNEKGRSLLRKGLGFIREHGSTVLRKVHNAIRIYYNRKLALVCALLLTFSLQGVCVAAMWLIGREIGLTAHAKYYFIFFPVSWLLGALPISVGGAGVMELWLKDIFIRVCKVSSEHAVVLAFCQRLLWLVGSLPGAAIHLLGAHLPKDFFVDYNKSID